MAASYRLAKKSSILFSIVLCISLLASLLSCADVDELDKPPSAGHNTEMDSDVDTLKVQEKEAISDTVDSEANVLNEIKDIDTCKKDCNTDLEQKVENSDVIDETDSQDKKDIEANTDIKDNLDDKSEEIIETGTNSTWMLWVRYFLDPFLEEFKDGIYSRSNKNSSDTNVSETVFNNSNLSNIHVINETVPDFLNITDSDQNSTDASKKTKFQCTGKNVTDNSNVTVQIVTSSKLLQLLSFEKNETENVTDCLVVMFYAPWCHFCAKMAPYYNALSRAFPQLDFVAVDTAQFSNLLARFGTVSVPNILVFHQSRAAVKFNQTERTFENFVSFVKNTTGLEANSTVNVTEADYVGPISSVPTEDLDIFLWISWLFVILYSSFMLIKSNKGQQWITRIQLLWQEHQHIE